MGLLKTYNSKDTVMAKKKKSMKRETYKSPKAKKAHERRESKSMKARERRMGYPS